MRPDGGEAFRVITEDRRLQFTKIDPITDLHSDAAVIASVIDPEKSAILESCAVGYCKSLKSIRELAISFRDAGCSGFKIMRISGSLVLLMFESPETRTKILEEKSLDQWLENVMVWQPTLQITTRRIWLSIQGIPIHAWPENTFRSIAAKWGVLVEIDQDIVAPSSFETCRIQIETDWNSHNDENFHLEVKSIFFPIRVVVMEEAIGPKCECCGIDMESERNMTPASTASDASKIGKDFFDIRVGLMKLLWGFDLYFDSYW
ncbi:hypothetical protein V6N11_060553 [Hibiscus sabdariffa]|uniref:DUF4283 domain-containing protein n=1 Tax=Hibiscus sabdariffa TaxID=183260 RepID=A0ABR2QQX4_9ROSI